MDQPPFLNIERKVFGFLTVFGQYVFRQSQSISRYQRNNILEADPVTP